MNTVRGLIQGVKGWLGKTIATTDTDPERFFSAMSYLPNPDPILRQMGKADEVYRSIMTPTSSVKSARYAAAFARMSTGWRLAAKTTPRRKPRWSCARPGWKAARRTRWPTGWR